MSQHLLLIRQLNSLEEQLSLELNKPLILNHLKLEESNLPPSELEKRTLEIAQTEDGRVEMASFKLYNLLRFNQSQFRVLLLGAIGAAGGLASTNPVFTIMGILGLIGAFLGASEHKFQTQEAEVLLSIYYLGQHCHITTIPPEYQTNFKKSLTMEQLHASLKELEQYRCVEIRGEEVLLTEQVNIQR